MPGGPLTVKLARNKDETAVTADDHWRLIDNPNMAARTPAKMPASGGTNQDAASLRPTNGQPMIGLS